MTDGFDSERLRRLDRAQRPPAEAEARIREQMLAAFDAALVDGKLDGNVDRDVDDDGTDLIVLDTERRTRRFGGFSAAPRGSRTPYLAAVAAAIVIVALGLGWTAVQRGEGQGPADTVPDSGPGSTELVETFCADSEARFRDVLGFRTTPGGEQTQRAQRALELLIQGYRDLGVALGDDAMVAEADLMAADAAATRRAALDSNDALDESVEALADDFAAALADLSDSDACFDLS